MFTVSGGTLVANGSTTSLGFDAAAGGALAGTGSLGATTASGGTITPGGDAAGTLTVASLALTANSTLLYDLGTAGCSRAMVAPGRAARLHGERRRGLWVRPMSKQRGGSASARSRAPPPPRTMSYAVRLARSALWLRRGGRRLGFRPARIGRLLRRERDGFTETGADSLNLTAQGVDGDLFRYGGGGFARFGGASGWFEASARYVTSSDDTQRSRQFFAGAPGTSFTVLAPSGREEGGLLSLAGEARLGGGFSLGGSGGYFAGKDGESVNGTVTLRLAF